MAQSFQQPVVSEPQPAPLCNGGNLEQLLVTIPQAATMLAVGRSSVYELIWSGDIQPVRIGRCVRIPVKQLQQFVRSRQG
jgi:excisionase family DNA binding protein